MVIRTKFSVNESIIPSTANTMYLVTNMEASGWGLSIKKNEGIWKPEISIYDKDMGEYIRCMNNTKIEFDTDYTLMAIYDGSDLKIYLYNHKTQETTQTMKSVNKANLLNQLNNINTIVGGNPAPNSNNIAESFYGTMYETELWYNVIFTDNQIEDMLKR